MSDLMVVAFQGEHTADDVLQKLKTMEFFREVEIQHSAVIRRDASGALFLNRTDDLAAEGFFSGTAMGGLWGLLIGALAANPAAGLLAGSVAGSITGLVTGAADDLDIDESFIKRFGEVLVPDSSALAFVSWTRRPDRLVYELEKFDGKVLETNLSAKDEQELRRALEKHVVK